ncbi:MAG: membrane protein insertase YidC [Deltaproteobacteria bacterium]|nr:membrane protein insertase YidC [Deltaproteobacteria bacterium]
MSSLPEPRPPGLDGGPGGQDSRRFVVVLALSMGLMVVMQSFAPPPKKKAPPADKPAVTAPVAPAAAAAPGEAAPATPEDAPAPEHVLELGGKVVRLGVSTHGGRVVRAELDGFKESRGADAVPAKARRHVDVAGDRGALALAFDGLAAGASYRAVEADGRHAVLERDGGGWHVTRKFAVMEDEHGLRTDTVVRNTGAAARSFTPALEFTARIHPSEHSGGGFLSAGVPTDQTGFLCQTAETLHREIAVSLKEPKAMAGSVKWAGIDRQYFIAAAAFRDNPPSDCRAEVKGDQAQLRISWPAVELGPGAEWKAGADAYFGPKHESLLTKVNPVLGDAIDYGWFGALVRLLLKLLLWFYELIPNYGIAIMLLTLSVKLATLPLTQRTFVSQQRMKSLAPKIKELQAKYAHDRAMQGQKMMDLYKQENASPFDGCFPMLVQMPIWIALYRTLYTAVELYQQPFISGWMDDLTQKDPFYITPVALGAVMLVQAWLTPVPPDQPQMKYMQYGMPVFFTTIMLALPAGLTVYMLTNTVLTILQQLYIKRRFGTPDTPAPATGSA